jgi:hypothetical protein
LKDATNDAIGTAKPTTITEFQKPTLKAAKPQFLLSPKAVFSIANCPPFGESKEANSKSNWLLPGKSDTFPDELKSPKSMMKEPLGGICGATAGYIGVAVGEGLAAGVGVVVGCPLSLAQPITPIARDSMRSDVNRIVSFFIYPSCLTVWQ